MKVLLMGSVIGLAMVGLMWVALDHATASLTHELNASKVSVQMLAKDGLDVVSVPQGYALTTQHIQPAYDTLPRTTLTEQLQ